MRHAAQHLLHAKFLPQLSDDELHGLENQLTAFERRVSDDLTVWSLLKLICRVLLKMSRAPLPSLSPPIRRDSCEPAPVPGRSPPGASSMTRSSISG